MISYFLVIGLFTMASTGEEIPDKYNGLITLVTVAITFATIIVIDYNTVIRLKSMIQKTKRDIESVDEIVNTLIDKAEHVTDKYCKSKTTVYNKFVEARNNISKISTAKDFKAVMEAYPEMQGNIHTQKSLNQIESTERERLSVKLKYTDIVASYNAKIHSFTIVMLRKICKWEDINVEWGYTREELVSDEELGVQH